MFRPHTKVIIPCHHCGKTTSQFAHLVKKRRSGIFFCDMACYRAWESTTKITVKCNICGKEFLRYTHHAQRNATQFCSPKCHGAWNTVHHSGKNHPKWVNELAVKCDNCGKEFRQKGRTRLARNKHNFCCGKCFAAWMVDNEVLTGENNHNWKGGGVDYYGPNWYEQARLARKRDCYKCRCCGISQKKTKRSLDVHHIIPFRTFGYIRGQNDNYLQANHLDNLISLCMQCHARAEAKTIPVQPTLLSV